MAAQTILTAGVRAVAAVVANFHMMTRIADSTGKPLDPFTGQMTGDLREALGLNDFDTKRFGVPA